MATTSCRISRATPTRIHVGVALEIRHEVVAIKVDFEGLGARLVAGQQLFLDVGRACRGQQGGGPVLMRNGAVKDRSWLDGSRPTDEEGHTIPAFPTGVLLAVE